MAPAGPTAIAYFALGRGLRICRGQHDFWRDWGEGLDLSRSDSGCQRGHGPRDGYGSDERHATGTTRGAATSGPRASRKAGTAGEIGLRSEISDLRSDEVSNGKQLC